ncbi:MAG: hypothetical protein ACK2TU_01260 [Anaerolineales bacterium]
MKSSVFRFFSITVVVLLVFINSLLASDRHLNIAVILWRGETRAEQGFKDGLKELGYTLIYIIFDCCEDTKNLGQILSIL